MATAIQILDKLERRITIMVPLADVHAEVQKRLKVKARKAKMPGFRPGKVPMKMLVAQYGYQIENDVLNDKFSQAFNAATNENNLRVAGFPKIEAKSDDVAEGIVAFNATFEVYPEVKVGDLSAADVEKTVAEVSEAEIDKTIDILRKQRVHYHVKGEQSAHGNGGSDLTAQNGDRVTIDFNGTIDSVEFQGCKAQDYAFVLGEGHMLLEFEAGMLGLKVGESRTFPLSFPIDYRGADVAGKTAEFKVTLKQIEWAHLPEVDAEFAKSLGITDGNLSKMRDDIKVNLQHEVSSRVKARTKESVMEALIKISELDVPKALIDQAVEYLMEMTRQGMQRRGIKVSDTSFPRELFTEQAERRVRLGLILAEVVKANELKAKPEQVKAQVEEFAQSYEEPQKVMKYYFSDRSRLAEVEALVLEENVVNYVLSKAKVAEKMVAFDELMGNNVQG